MASNLIAMAFYSVTSCILSDLTHDRTSFDWFVEGWMYLLRLLCRELHPRGGEGLGMWTWLSIGNLDIFHTCLILPAGWASGNRCGIPAGQSVPSVSSIKTGCLVWPKRTASDGLQPTSDGLLCRKCICSNSSTSGGILHRKYCLSMFIHVNVGMCSSTTCASIVANRATPF